MAVTRLARKARRNKTRVVHRKNKLAHLAFRPVIPKVEKDISTLL